MAFNIAGPLPVAVMVIPLSVQNKIVAQSTQRAVLAAGFVFFTAQEDKHLSLSLRAHR